MASHQLPTRGFPPLHSAVPLRLDVVETTPLKDDVALMPLMDAPPSPSTLDTALDTLIEGLETLEALVTEVAESTTGDGTTEAKEVVEGCAIVGVESGPWANINELEILSGKAA